MVLLNIPMGYEQIKLQLKKINTIFLSLSVTLKMYFYWNFQITSARVNNSVIIHCFCVSLIIVNFNIYSKNWIHFSNLFSIRLKIFRSNFWNDNFSKSFSNRTHLHCAILYKNYTVLSVSCHFKGRTSRIFQLELEQRIS